MKKKKIPMWKMLLAFIDAKHLSSFTLEDAIELKVCTSKSSLQNMLYDLKKNGYIDSWSSKLEDNERRYHTSITCKGMGPVTDESLRTYFRYDKDNGKIARADDEIDGVEFDINRKTVFSLKHNEAKKLVSLIKDALEIFKKVCEET